MPKKIVISEKEIGDISFERLEKALIYIRNNLINSNDNIYLTVDSLIDIITGYNNCCSIAT